VPSFTNTFGGTNIYSANPSYRAVALTANVTLTWPTEVATNTNVVASIMDVTPSAGSFTIRMPDASQASVGETALFFNVGAFSFTVADNGGNTIQTIASGEAWQVYLTDNTTVNGTWRSIEYGAGTSSPSASALAGAGLKAITTTLNQAAPTTLLSLITRSRPQTALASSCGTAAPARSRCHRQLRSETTGSSTRVTPALVV